MVEYLCGDCRFVSYNIEPDRYGKIKCPNCGSENIKRVSSSDYAVCCEPQSIPGDMMDFYDDEQ